MIKNSLCAALMLAAGAVLAADATPKDVASAAKKLAGSDNYTWTMTTESARFNNSSEGKWQKDGLVMLKTSFQDNPMTGYGKGGKGVIHTEDGWKTLDEVMNDNGGGGPNPGRMMARRLQNFKAPTDEVSDLAGKATGLTNSDGVISGALSEDTVKNLAAFGGRRGRQNATPPAVKDGKGTVKFWIKDGTLTKYQVKIGGSITTPDGDDRPIDRTTTTEFKDVGTTKIEVPEDAKGKLSS